MKKFLLVFLLICLFITAFITGCNETKKKPMPISYEVAPAKKVEFNFTKNKPSNNLNPQLKYNVFIDKNFNAKEKSIIKNSVLSWKTATDNIIDINVSFSDHEQICDYCTNIIPSNSKFVRSIGDAQTVAITTYNSYRDGSTIYIATDYIRSVIAYDPKILQRISTHEMGHAMNLSHGDNGTVMSAMTNTASDNITCKDLQNLFAIQGLIGEPNKKICHKK